jgi:hypothetical protein
LYCPPNGVRVIRQLCVSFCPPNGVMPAKWC